MKNLLEYDESFHRGIDQVIRQLRAEEIKPGDINLDVSGQSAVFSGSKNSIYNVTLERCECGGFIIRKLPCKHMYRLAV